MNTFQNLTKLTKFYNSIIMLIAQFKIERAALFNTEYPLIGTKYS